MGGAIRFGKSSEVLAAEELGSSAMKLLRTMMQLQGGDYVD